MRLLYGVLLLDRKEILVRIYEVNTTASKLLHYKRINLKKSSSTAVVEALADIFFSYYAQHVTEWKSASRYVSSHIIKDVSTATALSIERISHTREQELLCKGMLTELWGFWDGSEV